MAAARCLRARSWRCSRENGPQARILSPGFHFEPLINLLYTIDLSHPEISVPQGKVGVLTARDGAPLRSGQVFADPFPTDVGGNMWTPRCS